MMFKKNGSKVLVLMVALLISLSSTALAVPNTKTENSKAPANNAEHKCPKCKKHKGQFITKLASIKELGLTEEEIIAGSKANKTLYDLAKQKKGLTPEQVKSIIIKSKTENINKKVSEGKISKEEADLIIQKMKTKIENWDGNLKPKPHFEKSNQQQ